MSAPLVFLDTETTGVHPGRKVWEIGMIRRDDEGQRELCMFVDVDLADADPFGLKIGGFYDRHPLGRYLSGLENYTPEFSTETPRMAAQIVATWTHGAHIVGAVPNFDTEVLSTLLREHRYAPAWHYHLIDVEALAVGYLNASGARILTSLPWRSDDLTAALGLEAVPENERHTAMGDARWAMRIFDKVTGVTA